MKHVTDYLAELRLLDRQAHGGAIPEWDGKTLARIEQLERTGRAVLVADLRELADRVEASVHCLRPDHAIRSAGKYLRDHLQPLAAVLANVGEAACERRFDLQEAANDDGGGDYAA